MAVDQFNELAEREQFILAVTEKGFGKRTSAYEYRVTGRGGKGIGNLDVTDRNGPVAATFPHRFKRSDHACDRCGAIDSLPG